MLKKIAWITAALAVVITVGFGTVSRALANDANPQSNLNEGNSNSSKKTIDLACMSTAVTTRDAALVTAVNTFSTAWTKALTMRSDALKAAWTITVKKDRNAAIRAAWKAYNNAKKDASQAYRNARNAAWNTFNTSARACKGSPINDEGGSRGRDSLS